MEEKRLDKAQYDCSEGPLENRRCTDVIWVAIFIAHLLLFLGIVIVWGSLGGNLSKLYKPRDYRGDYCGMEVQWNDGPDLSGYAHLIFTMNVSQAVDPIAKRLVCSSAAEAALGGALSPGELEKYMCACCKTPCRACQASLPAEDLIDMSSLADSISGNIHQFSSLVASWSSAGDVFQPVCATDCSTPEYTGTEWREHRYSPDPDVPWKRAWDVLESDGPPQHRDIMQTVSAQFTFKALPKSLCPYPAADCVPFPGTVFAEVAGSGFCAMGTALNASQGLSDLAERLPADEAVGRVRESLGSAVGHIMETMDVLAIVCVLALTISLVYLVALRFFVPCAVWSALIVVFLGFLAGGAMVYVRSSQCFGASFFDSSMNYGAYTQDAAMRAVQGGGSSVNMELEVLNGDGADYRGLQTRTRTGRTCQRWDSMSPHSHTTTQAAFPGAGLEENYCRNPIESVSIWCYTTDPSTRWELCYPLGVKPFDSSTCPEGYVVKDEVARSTLRVFACTLFVCALVWLVACCCLAKQIRLAIVVNRAAARFVYTTPQVVLVPLLQAVAGMLWCAAWVTCAALVLSDVPEGYTPTEPFATFAEAHGTQDRPGNCTDKWPAGFAWKDRGNLLSADDPCSGNRGDTTGMTPRCWRCGPPRFVLGFRFAFAFFSLLWNNALLVALGQVIIAGACATWFFAGKKPLSRSTWNAFRYHFGSLAFGSFIISIVQFIRWCLYYLQKQAEAQKNRVMVVVLKVVQCCLWCFEKCLKFLCKNAYIQVAIMGTNFCTSAKNAFYLILRNAARFGFLEILGWVLESLGFAVIAMSTSVLGFSVLDALHPEVMPMGPMLLYILIACLTAKLFISVFSLAVDSMLQCYIAAEELECKACNVPLEFHKMFPDYKPDCE